MKRTVIGLAALGIFSVATVDTQAIPLQEENLAVVVKNDERKEIKYEELPKEVKTSFEDSQFSNWEVSKVHEVKEANTTRYEITISDGTQSGTIAYDEDGNMIG